MTSDDMELTRRATARVKRWILEVSEASQNPFWCLDIFLIAAGVKFTPRNRWQHTGWNLYRILTYSQLLIALAVWVSAVVDKEDVLTTVRTALIFLSFVLCLVKQRLFLRYSDGIEKIRRYLENPDFCSGDPTFDETARKRFHRTSRVLLKSIASVIAIQQLLSWIPNEQLAKIFLIPSRIGLYLGENVACFVQIWQISITAIIWLYKLYGCTVTAEILLVGLTAEQRILAHKFEQTQDILQDLRQNYWDSEYARTQYWERLRTLSKESVQQQQLLLKLLKDLKPFVNTLFFCIYYSALATLGSAAVIVIHENSLLLYVFVSVTVSIWSLECYSLCFLVDTLKDVLDNIAEDSLYLCARLPYSAEHHRDYVEMRTTLQIIAICSRNVVSFGCAGISDISVAVFAEMINNCYSMFTFLRDFVEDKT